MQRNISSLQQQQAMARQAQQQQYQQYQQHQQQLQQQQQRATTAGLPPPTPEQMSHLWAQQQQQQQQLQQQQHMQQLPLNNHSQISPQQIQQQMQQQQQLQQLENENRLKQQKLQQQRLASMYMQQNPADIQQHQQQQHLKQLQLQQKQQSPTAPSQQHHSMMNRLQQPHAKLSQTPPALTPHTTAALVLSTTLVENELQKKNLDLYKNRDETYQKTLDVQQKRHIQLAQEKKHDIDVASNERRLRQHNREISMFGKGYDGYRNGTTGMSARVVYPLNKKRKEYHQPIRLSYEAIYEQANKEEMLVPIRLDIDAEGYKIRDTFTWNMNESTITPDQFAEITCEDLRLPINIFVPSIANSIRDQIQDFFLNASSMINDSQDSTDSPNNAAFEELVKNKKEKDSSDSHEEEDLIMVKQENNQESNKQNQVKHSTKGAELRTLIKLDIIVGNRILNDQFEWDISCKNNSPESFAEAMVTDLGLGGEFKTAIAHSIREQVHVYIKSLLLTGYEFGDGPVENDELRRSFLPAVKQVLRDTNNIERFTPSLIEVTDIEIAKIEKGRIRESRRKKRGTRNRKGVILPDRDALPTYRTIFASPPEHEMTDGEFLKSMIQTSTEPSLSHSQRKSAMKARLNIAAEAAGVSLTSGELVNDEYSGGASGSSIPLQPNINTITRPVPSKMLDSSWRCLDCNCSPFMTTIIRAGPAGDKTLCNACGLYRYKYNSVRPQNYMDKEIKNDIPHLDDWQNHISKYRS